MVIVNCRVVQIIVFGVVIVMDFVHASIRWFKGGWFVRWFMGGWLVVCVCWLGISVEIVRAFEVIVRLFAVIYDSDI